MNMLIVIRAEADLLNVVATGKFSLNEAKRTFLEMLEAAIRHKTLKVLVDGRQLLGDPKRMERFYYGEFAARSVSEFEQRGLSRATQFAYVLKEPVLDPRRFGETVALNRGMHVKAFDNPDEAFKWLGITPAKKPGPTKGQVRT